MLAALHWGETPRRFAFSLAGHGIRGPLLASDVWSEQRRRDVDGAAPRGWHDRMDAFVYIGPERLARRRLDCGQLGFGHGQQTGGSL